MFISAPLVLERPDLPFIDLMFDEFGPIPRICLEVTSTTYGFNGYSAAVANAVNNLTLSKLEAMMFEGVLTPSDQSYKLFLLRRAQADDASSLPYLSPITNTMSRRLSAAFRYLKCADQILVYHQAIGRPGVRAFGDCMYEPYCLEAFRTQIQINYVPMVRLQDSTSRDAGKYESDQEGERKREYVRRNG
jgi:hypothetical protein